jgi:hypothetical protein
MFLVEIVTFMVAWPILWWLGGRLDREARAPSRAPSAKGPAPGSGERPREADNVVDLAAYRARKTATTRRGVRGA